MLTNKESNIFMKLLSFWTLRVKIAFKIAKTISTVLFAHSIIKLSAVLD